MISRRSNANTASGPVLREAGLVGARSNIGGKLARVGSLSQPPCPAVTPYRLRPTRPLSPLRRPGGHGLNVPRQLRAQQGAKAGLRDSDTDRSGRRRAEGRYRGAGERKRLAPWSPDGSNWTIAPEPSTSGIVATRKPSRHRAPAPGAGAGAPCCPRRPPPHVGRHHGDGQRLREGRYCGQRPSGPWCFDPLICPLTSATGNAK